MTTTIALMLLLQFTVLSKAGFVNFVQGAVNLRAGQSLDVGTSIRTGSGGSAEVLLSPGSCLRLSENSEAVLRGVDLPDIGVTIVAGTALIEAAGFDKKHPLEVTTGSQNVSMDVVDDGIYLISKGKITVLEGKAQVADGKAYGKGWQISNDTTPAIKIGKHEPSALENWSEKRSEDLAKANFGVGLQLRLEPNVSINDLFDVWIWDPDFGAFTFMPGYGFRSPYRHAYLAVQDIFVVPGLVVSRTPGPAPAGSVNTTTTAPPSEIPRVVISPPSKPEQPSPAPAPPRVR